MHICRYCLSPNFYRETVEYFGIDSILQMSAPVRYKEDARRHYKHFSKSSSELSKYIKTVIKDTEGRRKVKNITFKKEGGLKLTPEQFMNLKLLNKPTYDFKQYERYLKQIK